MFYLDYAAACPIRLEIAEQYSSCCRRYFANPHGGTCFAEECRRVILDAERRLLGCLAIPEESARVIWCSGGTEALNLAIAGLAEFRKIDKIVYDSTAHPAMLEPLKKLGRNGTTLLSLSVDQQGILQPFGKENPPPPFLCCCHVNNETGQIQPLSLLRKAAGAKCIFCIDAVQSFGRVSLPWEEVHIDLAVVSSRKIGGPASIGALICRKGLDLTAQILGGGQQYGLRSGTLDTVAIKLFVDSAELACLNRSKEAKRLLELNQYLRQHIEKLSNGQWPVFSSLKGVPDIFSFAIPGYEGALIARILAEKYQILIGTGSACSAESAQTSHVLKAMGVPDKIARCQLRISFGYATTKDNLDAFLEALPNALKEFPSSS